MYRQILNSWEDQFSILKKKKEKSRRSVFFEFREIFPGMYSGRHSQVPARRKRIFPVDREMVNRLFDSCVWSKFFSSREKAGSRECENHVASWRRKTVFPGAGYCCAVPIVNYSFPGRIIVPDIYRALECRVRCKPSAVSPSGTCSGKRQVSYSERCVCSLNIRQILNPLTSMMNLSSKNVE